MFSFKSLCTSAESHKPPHNHILWVPVWKKHFYSTLGSFTAATSHTWDGIVKLDASWHRDISVSAIILWYFACRNLIDIRCRVPWGLEGGVNSWLLFIAPKLQNVCQKNNMWECYQGSGSYMLVRVGQQCTIGRKTRLIAVLTEIRERDRSYQAWPHCKESYELAEESHQEAKLP